MDLVGIYCERARDLACISLPMVAEQDEGIIFPLSGRARTAGPGICCISCEVQQEMVPETTSGARLVFVVEPYLQRPGPLGGSIFKRDWFRHYDQLPETKPGMTVMSLDTALSSKNPRTFRSPASGRCIKGDFIFAMFGARIAPRVSRK